MTERIDIPVAGGELAAYRLGAADADAPTVVAVHGITANSHSWLPVSRALGRRVSLVAPDLRGRARSNGLPGPYGIAAYARDVIRVLDHLGLDRAVLAGHSLGAFVVARAAADHPDRVSGAVLVDGGLTLPAPDDVDPQEITKAVLGPALARLQMTFASPSDYHDWWHRHPAFGAGDIDEADLVAYADHDLVGQEPELRSSVVAQAVRDDADGLFEWGEPAHRLTIPATLVSAPRGLLNQPEPLQPRELIEQWVAEAPEQRRATRVPDVNHYELVLGRSGSAAVAAAIIGAVELAPDLSSARRSSASGRGCSRR